MRVKILLESLQRLKVSLLLMSRMLQRRSKRSIKLMKTMRQIHFRKQLHQSCSSSSSSRTPQEMKSSQAIRSNRLRFLRRVVVVVHQQLYNLELSLASPKMPHATIRPTSSRNQMSNTKPINLFLLVILILKSRRRLPSSSSSRNHLRAPLRSTSMSG